MGTIAYPRPAKIVTAILALGVVIWLSPWVLLPIVKFTSHAPRLTNSENVSHIVFDATNQPISFSLTGDEKFRTWTPFRSISPQLIEATLQYEDRYFYWHAGVNPYSLIRAFVSWLLPAQRSLGASTITMQLVRKRFNLNTRSLTGKARQIWLALSVESHYSKKQILEAYLNIIPYGGNIEGVGAASRIYFHKTAQQLTHDEAKLLTLLPQNPTKRGPNSILGKAALNDAWEKVFQGDATQIAARLYDKSEIKQSALHFSQRVTELYPHEKELYSTLDSNLQLMAEGIVSDFVEKNAGLGIKNATAMIVHAPRMEVRAYVGSAGYTDRSIQGFVNGLKAKRSPGSALKPFVYALGIDQGFITPDTILKDHPVRISDYRPENFERNFLGPLSATESLVRSRNVPAVELAQKLLHPTVYEFLKKGGVALDKSESFYGLSLVLGSIDVSMEELLHLYGIFVNNGELKPLRWLTNTTVDNESIQLIRPESSFLTREMLKSNPRPHELFGAKSHSTRDAVAWKTGTSYGSKDAWAIGIVGEYIVGVWIGNFDATPNPNFVGRDTAGPLLFSVIDAISSESAVGFTSTRAGLNLKQIEICPLSGLPASEHCPHKKLGWIVPGISPILQCNVHREVLVDPKTGYRLCAGQSGGVPQVIEIWDEATRDLFLRAGIKHSDPPQFISACQGLDSRESAARGPKIISPQARNVYQLRADEMESNSARGIELSALADGGRKLFWFIDKELIGEGSSIFWRGRAGTFNARAVDDQGDTSSVRFSVEVVN